MTPTWYELLGVAPDAGPETIKAAWRSATDKFEPGSGTGQFRLFNEAADVLLDPERRAAYDAELAGPGTDPGPEAESASPELEPEPQPEPESEPEPSRRGRLSLRKAPAPEQAPGGANAADEEAVEPLVAEGPAERPAPGWLRALGSPWLAASLAVLLLLALGTGGMFWYHNHRHDQAASAGEEASAVAERALPVVLSYDYRHLSADRDQAVKFLTPKYKKEYTATFDKLIESSDGKPGPAAQTSAVVTATVRSVGVVDAEPGLAKVIVFVDQATVKAGGTPKYSLNRLTVSLVKSGNSWLVNNINSY